MLQSMDSPSVEFTNMRGLEICRVAHSSHVFPRHFHDDLYSLGLMHRGACRCLGPGRDDATVAQGYACLINPGQVHAGGPVQDDGFSYTMFYLSLDLMRSLTEDLSRSPWHAPEFTALVSNRQDVCESLRYLALCLGRGNDMESESALVRALGQSSARFFAAAPSDSNQGVVGQVLADRDLASATSTVDNLPNAAGPLAAVLALAQPSGTAPGHYGIGSAASAVLPPVPAADGQPAEAGTP